MNQNFKGLKSVAYYNDEPYRARPALTHQGCTNCGSRRKGHFVELIGEFMRKLMFALVLSLAVISMPVFQSREVNAASQTIVTAAQVNGTWQTKWGEFKVWALGRQRLQIEFSGTYEYDTPSGPMANVGTGSGIAHIEGDTATFKPDGVDDDCAITMKFTHGKLIVTQEGGCGFG